MERRNHEDDSRTGTTPWREDEGRTAEVPFYSERALRKSWAKLKRLEHQSERARVRDEIHNHMHDPECLDELTGFDRRRRQPEAVKALKREWMLRARRRQVRAELKATKDVAGFIEGLGRSKTLYSLIAMDFFRFVLESPAYGEDSRFRQAIVEALEDPGLNKVIRHKWQAFDREFPGLSAA
jgi:hypothetical protein